MRLLNSIPNKISAVFRVNKQFFSTKNPTYTTKKFFRVGSLVAGSLLVSNIFLKSRYKIQNDKLHDIHIDDPKLNIPIIQHLKSQLRPVIHSSNSQSNKHLTKELLKDQDLIEHEYSCPEAKVYYLGSKVCGHSGVVHGGFLATLLQESAAEFANVNHNEVQASYSVNYLSFARANQPIIILLKGKEVKNGVLHIKCELVDKDGKPLTNIEAKFFK